VAAFLLEVRIGRRSRKRGSARHCSCRRGSGSDLGRQCGGRTEETVDPVRGSVDLSKRRGVEEDADVEGGGRRSSFRPMWQRRCRSERAARWHSVEEDASVEGGGRRPSFRPAAQCRRGCQSRGRRPSFWLAALRFSFLPVVS
jgi:hypothetical protein